jgi:hypothetical protein
MSGVQTGVVSDRGSTFCRLAHYFGGYQGLKEGRHGAKRERIGGLMLCRDWGRCLPWPTWPKPDFTHLSRKVKEVIRAAGLRNELSFTSFRHSGFTETRTGQSDPGCLNAR